MSDRSFEFISNDPVGYERLFGRGRCHLSVPFIEFAGVMAHEKVLDVGCGTGNLTISLAASKAFATGIDLSWSYLHHARQRISDASVKFTLGDAMKLPYQDDSFDRTLSMLALDLFLDPVLCLSEMRRVTRPGGIVAALVIG